jgi:hypothetical protein
LVYFIVIWYIFLRFGMKRLEKSGNPALRQESAISVSLYSKIRTRALGGKIIIHNSMTREFSQRAPCLTTTSCIYIYELFRNPLGDVDSIRPLQLKALPFKALFPPSSRLEGVYCCRLSYVMHSWTPN